MNFQQNGSSLDLQLFAGRLRSMVPPTKGNAGNDPSGNTGMSLRSGKVLATIACAVILLLQLVAMSKWPNIRGIHDDLCYLRQAHLFQTLGVHGLNTDITLDNDNYFRDLIKPVVPDGAPVCHPVRIRMVIAFSSFRPAPDSCCHYSRKATKAEI